MNTIYTVDSFLIQVSQSQKYKILIGKGSQIYQISCFNLQKLTIKQIKNIRKKLIRDLQDEPINQKKHLNKNKNVWSNNQLKLFVWVIICYSQLTQRHISDLTEEDWNFLVTVVPTKSIEHLKYEALKLHKQNLSREKWTKDEDELLISILNQQKIEGQWNEVSRLFYFKSQKKYFKSPRKCRERWYNHLSLSISRQKWTLEEDLNLFQSALDIGRKWALISKSLDGSRTEHMIKNRYKCKMNKLAKAYPSISQYQLLKKKIQMIKTQIKRTNEGDKNEQKMKMQTQNDSKMEESQNQIDQLDHQNSKELTFNLLQITGIINPKTQLMMEQQIIEIDSNYKQFQSGMMDKDDYFLNHFPESKQDLFGLLP